MTDTPQQGNRTKPIEARVAIELGGKDIDEELEKTINIPSSSGTTDDQLEPKSPPSNQIIKKGRMDQMEPPPIKKRHFRGGKKKRTKKRKTRKTRKNRKNRKNRKTRRR